MADDYEDRRGTIPAGMAARLIGVDQRRLQQLVAAGWINRPSRGSYEVVSVVQGYIRFLRDPSRRAAKSAEENRLLDARAREIERRTTRAEMQLIPAEEAVAYARLVVDMVMERLDELPAKFARDAEQRRRLDADISDVRSEMNRLLAEPAF